MRIIIIGAGPGGYETAVEAAKRGIEVLIVSDGPVGGTCLNEGCIPTKTFCNMDAPDQERKMEVISTLRGGVEGLLGGKNITLVYGKASFVDSQTIAVGSEKYSGDAIIIATGSVSASLPVPGADLPGVITSKEILDLGSAPARLCVIGGGVIGLEFASIFRKFGSDVTVLEYCPNLLPRFDVDLSKRLKQSLGKRGIAIETSAQVFAISGEPGAMKVSYRKKEEEFSVDADLVLMAVGRRANVESLNLADVGIEFSRKGIVVDENMQTSAPGIYAVGDVNGGIMLAHVASYEGLRALNHICGESDCIDFSVVPSAVFTEPEVATVGRTEEELKEAGVAFKAQKSFFRANGKALSMGKPDGYCKLLVGEADDKILGCHIIGEHASDIIHEASILINAGVTVKQAKSFIFAHPTLSEVLRSCL